MSEKQNLFFFNGIDTRNTGAVSKEELWKLVESFYNNDKLYINILFFRVIDKNRENKIDANGFVTLAELNGVEITEEQSKYQIKEFTNGRTTFNFAEAHCALTGESIPFSTDPYYGELSQTKIKSSPKTQTKPKMTEIERLTQQNKEYEKKITIQSKEIKDLQAKLDSILRKQEESKTKTSTNQDNKTFSILDSKSINDLEKLEEIGSGGGGKVFKVAQKSIYALKVMNISEDSFSDIQQFMKEYEIMNILHHPNILKTHGIFLSDSKNAPSILLEYCPKNLNQMIKKKEMNNIDIICIIYQIVEGMKYVHFRKVIHRDLKPSNIFITEDKIIKIGDFGISKLMSTEEQITTRGAGTQKFMAPEIINEDEYNEKVDVYSFGVIVYMLLSDGQMPSIKIRDIILGKKAPIPSSFTAFARKLIDSCWCFEPNQRPSFEKIAEDLYKNKYNLINLNKSEYNQVESFIKNHKKLIPSY